MGSETLLLLAATEAKLAAKECSGDVTAKVAAAMDATREHWMVTDPNVRLKAAIVGVCMAYPEFDPDRLRIEAEWRCLASLARGELPSLDDITAASPPIGLRKLWLGDAA